MTKELNHTGPRGCPVEESLSMQHEGSSRPAQPVDESMRWLMSKYDALLAQRASLTARGRKTAEQDSDVAQLLARERMVQAKLEFACDQLGSEQIVLAACLSTISLHNLLAGESSVEQAYSVLRAYFTGGNSLPFSQLGVLMGGEEGQLMDAGSDGPGDAHRSR